MSNNTPIDKRYYSFVSNQEQQQSPFQIIISNEDFYKEEYTPYKIIDLGEGKKIIEWKYDEKFLWALFWLDPLEIDLFLDYHLERYTGEQIRFYDKLDLMFSETNLDHLREKYTIPDEEFSGFIDIEDHIIRVRSWIGQPQRTEFKTRLKWNGSPSQFGHVFRLLADSGFIDAPLNYKGEINCSKYAKICWEIFEFESASLENLEKEIRNTTLSGYKKNLFKFPKLGYIR